MTRWSVVLTVLLVVAVSGCGGGNGNSGTIDGPQAGQVAARFHTLTGAALKPAGQDTPDWSLYENTEDRFDQYGVFSMYVVKTERGRKTLLSDQKGRPLPRDGDIYWDRSSDGSYSATRQFGSNVIVVWQAGKDRQVDDHFQALARAMSQAAGTGKLTLLPPADRQCAAAGIDPSGGTQEGTCRLGSLKLTIVNAPSILHTPVLDAKLVGVDTAKSISGRTSFDRPDKARGTFVAVAYRLNNTGDQPLEFLDEKLVVDGKTYTADSGVDFDLNPKDPLPLQPGEKATLRAAFDVPPAVADRVRADGALSLPAARFESSSGLDDSVAQGRIRLAGAPSGGLPKGAIGPNSVTAQTAKIRAAIRQFFAAIRNRDTPAYCSRLTRAELSKRGGQAGCTQHYTVKPEAAGEVPKAETHIKFETLLLGKHRATVIVTGGGYGALLAMVQQGGRWRIRGFRKTS
jgi:hypothetical protein